MRSRLLRSRLFPALFVVLLTSALVACGIGPNRHVGRITPQSQSVTLARTIADTNQAGCTPVASTQPLATGSHASTISNAYQNILRNFIRPLDSSSLLNAAWQGALAEITKEGGSDPGIPAPQLTDSSADADWQTFTASYDKLSGATNGKVDQVQMAFSAVSKMADSVNEKHTYFIPPEEYAQEGKEEVLSGGIGVVLNGTIAPFIVEEVVPGGPADQAGVLPGDSIVDVNSCDVSAWTATQLTSQVRGQAGTTVDLTLDRPSSGDYEAEITRAKVTFPDVTSRMLPQGAGYIDLHEFPSASAVLTGGRQLRDTLTDLLSSFQAQGAKGWILDLRDDPGGEVPAVQTVAGLVLPPGVVFSATDRFGQTETWRTIGARVPAPPLLAVLVDGGSASGSEILAAAIQDDGAAPIVGTKTAGVANAANLFSLGDGAGISVTVLQTYTPHGRALNGSGVMPDFQAERSVDDLAAGSDPPLEAVVLGVVPRLEPSPAPSLPGTHRYTHLGAACGRRGASPHTPALSPSGGEREMQRTVGTEHSLSPCGRG